MCTVEKMLIKGIRSFSPENQTVIEFYKPLTLIVGANGAGKTTVIECLKQACTGELPPNTRSGQSFIHDPKVAHEPEVKAQIKLRLNTSLGQPVVVLRSFQLTQKKTTMQFKTLDSTLQTINRDTGQKQALTYRCADIDKLVPSLMGVSKAVLENVIFVHQEESNWPLAEGKVLKDKFDDIFSATKYTKALEALRKLRTEKVAEVKLMKANLETLRTHRDQALRLKREVLEGQDRASELEGKIREIESQVQVKQDAMEVIERKMRSISDLMAGSEAARARHEMLTRQTHEKLQRIKGADLEETDAELELHISNFEQVCRDMQTRMEELQRQVGVRRIDKEAFTDKYQRDCLNHGRLAAEASAHAAACSELQRFVAHCAAALGLPLPAGFSSLASSADASAQGGGGAALVAAATAFLREVEGRRLAVEGQARETKSSFRSREQIISEAIDRASAAVQRSAEGAKMKREQAARNESEMARIEAEVSFLVVSTGEVGEAREMVEELEGRLQGRQGELSRSTADQEATQEKQAIDDCARRLSELRQERERLSAASDTAVRHRLRRQELAGKEEALGAFLTRCKPRLLGLLGLPLTASLPAEGAIREEADRALAGKRAGLAAKGRELQEAQAARSAVQGSLGASKSLLMQLESQIGPLRAALRAGMAQAAGDATAPPPPEDAFESSLKEVKTSCDKHGGRVATAKAIMTVLNQTKMDIEEGDACPTCRRGFADQQEKQQVLHLVTQDIEDLPARLAAAAAELERSKRRLELLQALQPQHTRLNDLQRQLPEVRAKVEADEGKLRDLVTKAEGLKEEYAASEVEVAEAAKVCQEAAWQVDRQYRELDELRRQLGIVLGGGAGGMDASQAGGGGGGGGGGGRTPRDVDELLSKEEAAKSEHERRRDEALRRQARLKDDLLALTGELAGARADLARIGEGFAKRSEAEARLKELSAQSLQLLQQAEALQQDHAPKASEREKLLQEREAFRQQGSQREAEDVARLREVQQTADQLSAKLRPLSEYESRGRAAELQRVDEALKDLKGRMEAGQKEILKLEEEVASLRSSYTDRTALLREASDVLDYRKSKRGLRECEAEIKEMENKVAQFGDRTLLSRQLSGLQSEREELRRTQDVTRGQIQAIKQAIQRASSELNASANYQKIEGKFNEMRLKLRTTELANDDLDKYHKALEKALLTFHTSKMSDINKVIKELWQKTYRGQDIDYIQVKADSEGQGNRSYNYRVVMYSGGAELEMRGRCSAGQKVLACLIIRLALAETFCLNCGILALDEPTTNLDSENSASLAEALRAIMMGRRDQENFQLIVITHDETFARLLGTHDNTDYLWRITKDENQHTKIACEAIE